MILPEHFLIPNSGIQSEGPLFHTALKTSKKESFPRTKTCLPHKLIASVLLCANSVLNLHSGFPQAQGTIQHLSEENKSSPENTKPSAFILTYFAAPSVSKMTFFPSETCNISYLQKACFTKMIIRNGFIFQN